MIYSCEKCGQQFTIDKPGQYQCYCGEGFVILPAGSIESAKPKQTRKSSCFLKGCGFFILAFFCLAVITARIADTNNSGNETISNVSDHQKELQNAFAALKQDAEIDNFSVSKNKIKIVYKNDLPEMAMFRMRDYAESGSRITNSAFTAECSVSAEPGKILYSERRENRKTTAITFSENLHAKDKKEEEKRLAEARRQKTAALQKEIENRAYTAFYRRFVSDWDGSCRPVVKAVKATMHDPASFKHIKSNVCSVTGEKDMYLVEMTFQGKNAFNATVTNRVSAKLTKDGYVVSLSSIN